MAAKPEAYAAYFLPLRKEGEGHQLDLLADYLQNPSINVDSSEWPQCARRIHAWTDGPLFYCVNANCALAWSGDHAKELKPQDCQNCPVRCTEEG